MASISKYVVTRLSSLKCSAISRAVDFTQKSVANPPRNTLTFSWGVFGVMIDSSVSPLSLLPSHPEYPSVCPVPLLMIISLGWIFRSL